MKHTKTKQLTLLLLFVLTATCCGAYCTNTVDGLGHIQIKETQTHGMPKGASIQASINGHFLAVVFTENLGQVSVEVATTAGASVQCLSVLTPNGLQVYIPNAGDYIITFTLSNGDVYYGEFEVM